MRQFRVGFLANSAGSSMSLIPVVPVVMAGGSVIENRIVQGYMNIDMAIIRSLVIADQYRFVVDYLRSPFAGVPPNQDS